MLVDGQIYLWVVDGDICICCLFQFKNGVFGEGFFVVMLDGMCYYFDMMIIWQMLNFCLCIYYIVFQYKVYLVVLCVEDQQGNWVMYIYVNDNFVFIQFNDGCRIDLVYQNGCMVSVMVVGCMWQYQYCELISMIDGGLVVVIFFDVICWSYDWVGSV